MLQGTKASPRAKAHQGQRSPSLGFGTNRGYQQPRLLQHLAAPKWTPRTNTAMRTATSRQARPQPGNVPHTLQQALRYVRVAATATPRGPRGTRRRAFTVPARVRRRFEPPARLAKNTQRIGCDFDHPAQRAPQRLSNYHTRRLPPQPQSVPAPLKNAAHTEYDDYLHDLRMDALEDNTFPLKFPVGCAFFLPCGGAQERAMECSCEWLILTDLVKSLGHDLPERLDLHHGRPPLLLVHHGAHRHRVGDRLEEHLVLGQHRTIACNIKNTARHRLPLLGGGTLQTTKLAWSTCLPNLSSSTGASFSFVTWSVFGLEPFFMKFFKPLQHSSMSRGSRTSFGTRGALAGIRSNTRSVMCMPQRNVPMYERHHTKHTSREITLLAVSRA